MAKDIFEELMDRIGVEVPWHVIDELVVTDPNTLRPVKGAAFEILFDEVVNKHLKCRIELELNREIFTTLIEAKI